MIFKSIYLKLIILFQLICSLTLLMFLYYLININIVDLGLSSIILFLTSILTIYYTLGHSLLYIEVLPNEIILHYLGRKKIIYDININKIIFKIITNKYNEVIIELKNQNRIKTININLKYNNINFRDYIIRNYDTNIIDVRLIRFSKE